MRFEEMNTDWKERLKEEYAQVKRRYNELHKMLIKHEAGTLAFMPNCPMEVLEEQAHHMENYMRILEIRAEIEHIDLG